MNSMTRPRCLCGNFSSYDGYCRWCRPAKACQEYPATCAPMPGEGCCMEREDSAWVAYISAARSGGAR